MTSPGCKSPAEIGENVGVVPKFVAPTQGIKMPALAAARLIKVEQSICWFDRSEGMPNDHPFQFFGSAALTRAALSSGLRGRYPGGHAPVGSTKTSGSLRT